MVLPAFVLRGSLDRWYYSFSVTDAEGKSYSGVVNLRDETIEKCELNVDTRYAKAEDLDEAFYIIEATLGAYITDIDTLIGGDT